MSGLFLYMKKFWFLVENLLGVYRWHPKIALRYLPVVNELRKRHAESVLEVGSNGLGIAPYFKRRVVGLDVHFAPPFHPDLIAVRGSATAIPFADKSYAAVISLDMLEHIEPSKRKQVIQEMLRVAKSQVCIGVPCGVEARQQDEELRQIYKNKHGKDFTYLAEQVTYGVPEKRDVLDYIQVASQSLKRRVHIRIQGNINLKLRFFLMQGWMSSNLFINLIFRKLMLLCIPILRRLNQAPVYRQLFLVTIYDA